MCIPPPALLFSNLLSVCFIPTGLGFSSDAYLLAILSILSNPVGPAFQNGPLAGSSGLFEVVYGGVRPVPSSGTYTLLGTPMMNYHRPVRGCAHAAAGHVSLVLSFSLLRSEKPDD